MPRDRRGWWAIAGCLVVAVILSLWWRPALSMPDAVRIPILEPHAKGRPAAAALFRHGRHDQFQCASCHPNPFPQFRVGFTHRDMNEGRFCGACHDGTGGFAIRDANCEDCHVD